MNVELINFESATGPPSAGKLPSGSSLRCDVEGKAGVYGLVPGAAGFGGVGRVAVERHKMLWLLGFLGA